MTTKTTKTTTRAYDSGYDDGADRVQEDARSTGETPDVSRWFGPGQETADTALINACDTKQLAKVLGITVSQVRARGEVFDAACAEYNRGFEAGAKDEAR